ncbi:Zinc finger C3H1 domain-containing protein [Podochytrium sp. JEL0797]|nr:Zinc finger C3H1 domain-containing protein [Podochytrium sp. JEL0797]
MEANDSSDFEEGEISYAAPAVPIAVPIAYFNPAAAPPLAPFVNLQPVHLPPSLESLGPHFEPLVQLANTEPAYQQQALNQASAPMRRQVQGLIALLLSRHVPHTHVMALGLSREVVLTAAGVPPLHEQQHPQMTKKERKRVRKQELQQQQEQQQQDRYQALMHTPDLLREQAQRERLLALQEAYGNNYMPIAPARYARMSENSISQSPPTRPSPLAPPPPAAPAPPPSNPGPSPAEILARLRSTIRASNLGVVTSSASTAADGVVSSTTKSLSPTTMNDAPNGSSAGTAVSRSPESAKPSSDDADGSGSDMDFGGNSDNDAPAEQSDHASGSDMEISASESQSSSDSEDPGSAIAKNWRNKITGFKIPPSSLSTAQSSPTPLYFSPSIHVAATRSASVPDLQSHVVPQPATANRPAVPTVPRIRPSASEMNLRSHSYTTQSRNNKYQSQQQRRTFVPVVSYHNFSIELSSDSEDDERLRDISDRQLRQLTLDEEIRLMRERIAEKEREKRLQRLNGGESAQSLASSVSSSVSTATTVVPAVSKPLSDPNATNGPSSASAPSPSVAKLLNSVVSHQPTPTPSGTITPSSPPRAAASVTSTSPPILSNPSPSTLEAQLQEDQRLLTRGLADIQAKEQQLEELSLVLVEHDLAVTVASGEVLEVQLEMARLQAVLSAKQAVFERKEAERREVQVQQDKLRKLVQEKGKVAGMLRAAVEARMKEIERKEVREREEKVAVQKRALQQQVEKKLLQQRIEEQAVKLQEQKQQQSEKRAVQQQLDKRALQQRIEAQAVKLEEQKQQIKLRNQERGVDGESEAKRAKVGVDDGIPLSLFANGDFMVVDKGRRASSVAEVLLNVDEKERARKFDAIVWKPEATTERLYLLNGLLMTEGEVCGGNDLVESGVPMVESFASDRLKPADPVSDPAIFRDSTFRSAIVSKDKYPAAMTPLSQVASLQGLDDLLTGAKKSKFVRIHEAPLDEQRYKDLIALEPLNVERRIQYAESLLPDSMSLKELLRTHKGITPCVNVLAEALPTNRDSEDLWLMYVELYMKRAGDQDVRDIFEQGVAFVPESLALWWRYFVWETAFEAKEKVLKRMLDKFGGGECAAMDALVRSSTVLAVVVQLVKLYVGNSDSTDAARAFMSLFLMTKDVQELAKFSPTTYTSRLASGTYLPAFATTWVSTVLNFGDLARAWLIYLHLLYHGTIPDSVFLAYPNNFLLRDEFFMIKWDVSSITATSKNTPSGTEMTWFKQMFQNCVSSWRLAIPASASDTESPRRAEFLVAFLAIIKNLHACLEVTSSAKRVWVKIWESVRRVLEAGEEDGFLLVDGWKGLEVRGGQFAVVNRRVKELLRNSSGPSMAPTCAVDAVVMLVNSIRMCFEGLEPVKFPNLANIPVAIEETLVLYEKALSISTKLQTPDLLAPFKQSELTSNVFVWLNYLLLSSIQFSETPVDVNIRSLLDESFKRCASKHERYFLWRELVQVAVRGRKVGEWNAGVAELEEAMDDLGVVGVNPVQRTRGEGGAEFCRLVGVVESHDAVRLIRLVLDGLQGGGERVRVVDLLYKSRADLVDQCPELAKLYFESNSIKVGKDRMLACLKRDPTSKFLWKLLHSIEQLGGLFGTVENVKKLTERAAEFLSPLDIRNVFANTNAASKRRQ